MDTIQRFPLLRGRVSHRTHPPLWELPSNTTDAFSLDFHLPRWKPTTSPSLHAGWHLWAHLLAPLANPSPNILQEHKRINCFSDVVFFCLFFFLIYLFIYFWLCWVFISVRGLSLVAASGGHSSSRCAGLSLSRPLLWRSTGSRRAGSVVVAHGLSCSAACGIFPDRGSNPCPLQWQADSQPLRHQGSPQM